LEAEEALRIGLVSRVVPDERVLDEARALAATIAARGPLALRVAKLVLSAAAYGPDSTDAAERLGQGILFESDDKAEGLSAFLARRPPRFRGR
ncbi:MAG TPA: enoyl-CoA hydratase-related protein, partial [Candidatus Polarisedimenticolia bacterium]|nr:enoyl-CoA hydratase-related protein [Candidatus Polarisedimenticolia bacterium]